jgi:hypothetical protein
MDYGWRYLLGLYPLAYLGIIFFLNRVHKRPSLFVRGLHSILVVLCMFSLLSQILFGATPDLTLKDTSHDLGYIEGRTSYTYTLDVLKAVPQPATWIGLFSIRTPLFIVQKVLNRNILDVCGQVNMDCAAVTQRVPDDLIKLTLDAPKSVSVQIGLVLLSSITGYWFLRRSCKRLNPR